MCFDLIPFQTIYELSSGKSKCREILVFWRNFLASKTAVAGFFDSYHVWLAFDLTWLSGQVAKLSNIDYQVATWPRSNMKTAPGAAKTRARWCLDCEVWWKYTHTQNWYKKLQLALEMYIYRHICFCWYWKYSYIR